jgi:hypothetical protein
MSVYGRSVSVDIDANDVLDELSFEEIVGYVEDKYSGKTVEINRFNTIDNDSLINYLVTEYHRGPYSDFDFNKFFQKVGINANH